MTFSAERRGGWDLRARGDRTISGAPRIETVVLWRDRFANANSRVRLRIIFGKNETHLHREPFPYPRVFAVPAILLQNASETLKDCQHGYTRRKYLVPEGATFSSRFRARHSSPGTPTRHRLPFSSRSVIHLDGKRDARPRGVKPNRRETHERQVAFTRSPDRPEVFPPTGCPTMEVGFSRARTLWPVSPPASYAFDVHQRLLTGLRLSL